MGTRAGTVVDESALRVVVAGLALAGAMYLLDAVYFPLLLVGPPVTGVLVARRGGRRTAAVGPWVVAGLGVLAYDAVVHREDVVFHVAVTAFTALTAWAAWALRARTRRTATA